MLHRHRAVRSLVGIGVVVITAGCMSDGPPEADDATVTGADTTPISVAIPPARLTPFCGAMIELTDTVRGDAEVDAKALIIETYRAIESEVPPEIADDFAAVLNELETGVPAPTLPPVTQPDTPLTSAGSTPGPAADESSEFFFGGSTPAERVNEYVAFACRDAENNPGPAATQPLENEPEPEPDSG